MKIQNKLTLVSSLVFGVVFLIASFAVYFVFTGSSQKLIFDELERNSRLAAFFYLEEDELPKSEHREIALEFEKIIEQDIEVRVFDEANNIKYGKNTLDEVINTQILNSIRKQGKLSFRNKNFYYLGIFYKDNQGDFVVMVKENREDFRSQLNILLLTLFGVFLAGLFAIIFISRGLSKLAYQPVRTVINEVKNLDIDSLEKSLTTPKTRDELQELVITFNDLLKRLSDSIIIQKNFINYVSHEFKTPLASISGNLEVFTQSKNKSEVEQEKVAKEIIRNVHQVKDILNTLMELSGLTKGVISNEKFRIDEKIWDIINKSNLPNTQNIIPEVNIPAEQSQLLSVKGNATQLEMALFNLLENALKYSNNQVIKINFSLENKQLKISIIDKGKGIPESELKNIVKPFYRGSNVENIAGSGIGLSIAKIIFHQHEIDFKISSKLDVGTTIELIFSQSF